MGSLAQDVRLAVRTLAKNAGFTLVAVICLTLGIATNTTLFSVTDAVLLRPFPFSEPERLVVAAQRNTRSGDDRGLSYPDFVDLRRELRAFTGLAVEADRSLAITDGEEPERLIGGAVSADIFQLLGVGPQLGRLFRTDEDLPGAEGVVLLSDELWRRRYNGDSATIGRSISVNGVARTVVGVMPPGFTFPEVSQLWIPAGPISTSDARTSTNYNVYARLGAGVTAEQAEREFQTVFARIALANGRTLEDWTGDITPLRDAFIPDDIRLVVLAMMGAVTFVLLIACANVANLVLARASGRQREIAIRSAIGAGRRHIVRQLLTESILIAIVAGLLAIPLTQLGLGWLDASIPAEASVPYYIDWRLDWRTMLYTFGVSIVTGALFGLAPALQAGRTNLVSVLKEGGRGSGSGQSRGRLRNALVVAEVSLCLVLLVGASLFVRSFAKLRALDSGFDTAPIMTMRVYLPGTRYDSSEARLLRMEDIARRVQVLPGVEAIGVSSFTPFTSGPSWSRSTAEGQDIPLESRRMVTWTAVTHGYLASLGVGMASGRMLTEGEAAGDAAVAVIQRGLAQLLWPNSDPLGARFRVENDSGDTWFTVVGVMNDFKFAVDQGGRHTPPLAFVPFRFQQSRNYGLVVRVRGDPSAITGAVRDAIRGSDAALPVFGATPLEQARRNEFWQYALFGGMFAVFGAIALVLAAVGVYGVIAYSVSQRTQEIGVRMALGAGQRDVLGMVLGQGLRLAGVGIAIGIVGALGVTRLVASLLYDVSPSDPLSFAAVITFLVSVALLASYIPARRATGVAPVIALRDE